VTLDERLGSARLPPAVETAAFRIVQEALGNALRHAGAPAIDITLRREPALLAVAVHDRGTGFSPVARAGRGLGLSSMDERARLVGGRLTIASAPGQGTSVEAWLPVHRRAGHG
jgi:signal transduction histidine kinase